MMNSIPSTVPEVGTQTTEVDLPVKTTHTANSTDPFGVPIEEVESPGQSPFGKFQGMTFDIQGHSSVVTGMFIRDLDQEITKYESKIKQLKEGAFSAADSSQAPKTHTELKALEDAFNIIKAGQQYRTHWILQKAQYEKNFGNKKQPAVSFAIALNQEQEILNKNIDKIMDIAKRVEELHELKKKWTIACNELKEAGQAQSDRVVRLNKQINKAQGAINQYLQFAETIRDKDIIEKDSPHKPALMATAKEAKETGHANYFSVLTFEANEQVADYTRQAGEARNQGNEAKAERYKDAFLAAEEAAMQFEQASKAGISEDAQNTYILSGRYKLKQAEAILQENEAKAERYLAASFAAKAAANQFQCENKAGISADEKNAYNLSGRYCLQQAQAILQENEAEAKRYNNAALAAYVAAAKFGQASIADSEDEKNVWNLSARYKLKQAKVIVQGNEEEAKQYEAEAKRYDDVALPAGIASHAFDKANKVGISEDEKNAWDLSEHYYLQQVKEIVQGNEEQARQYGPAGMAAWDAAVRFRDANKAGILEDQQNAYNLSARYKLKYAEAILQGNEAEAKQCENIANAAYVAANQFKYANKERISEDEQNAQNLSARYNLKYAEAIVQGNEAEAKQCEHVVQAAERAVDRFQYANKQGISGSQRSRLLQQGNDFLARAKRLDHEIVQAKKQKEGQERREQETKEWHKENRERIGFKRGI